MREPNGRGLIERDVSCYAYPALILLFLFFLGHRATPLHNLLLLSMLFQVKIQNRPPRNLGGEFQSRMLQCAC